MEKQVIFRDRQELQAADLNNAQAHASDSLQHLRQDAVSNALHYTGGLVGIAAAAEVSVAPLRFYNDGRVYVSEDTLSLNLQPYLPLVAKKIVAVVAWGEEIDNLVEPRDFLIDLTTGATQPQAVAMQRLRVCNINLLPGAESADPQPPVIQTNTLAIAWVVLAPTGIERVEMQTAHELPSLKKHSQDLGELNLWRRQAEPRIASIATDLAALSTRTEGMASRAQFLQMAGDLARTKALLNLPASYAAYDADHFVDDSKTDTAGAAYGALVQDGLLFPRAGQAVAPIALFNPYDAAVARSAQDLVLPAYTSRARLRTEGYAGDLSISQYQVQTQTLRAYTIPKTEIRYGYSYNHVSGWYASNSRLTPHKRSYNAVQLTERAYTVTTHETHYELADATTSYNGAIVAQTFLAANAMWLTQVGLQFTQVGAAGDVRVVVCETDGGKPNLGRTLAQVTVPQADLKRYPVETPVPVPPVLLEAGKRYALALITQGDHRVAIVSGNQYAAGTLFFGTDGDYFTGDLTRDLMFTLYAAVFAQPRIEVQLQPISLAGGMTDLFIQAAQVVPDGTQLHYEIQVGGRWYRIDDEAGMHLDTAPDIVPLRAVFNGTADLAPALQLTTNAVHGSRPGTALVHWSTERSLAAPTDSVEVQVAVGQWDAAHHTLSCELHDGATVHTAAATVVREELDGETQRFVFTFTPAPDLSTYQVRLAGSRSSGARPFVILERTDVAL